MRPDVLQNTGSEELKPPAEKKQLPLDYEASTFSHACPPLLSNLEACLAEACSSAVTCTK